MNCRGIGGPLYDLFGPLAMPSWHDFYGHWMVETIWENDDYTDEKHQDSRLSGHKNLIS